MSEPRLVSVPAWMHPARAVYSDKPYVWVPSDGYKHNWCVRFRPVDPLTPVLVERGELERARG